MKRFYAKDYADADQLIHSFATKQARDNFVADGNRRFSLTAKECDALCQKKIGMAARDAVAAGYI